VTGFSWDCYATDVSPWGNGLRRSPRTFAGLPIVEDIGLD